MAAPGEFTKRAFLNGRIGFEQAEGVLSMVNARTERAREAASRFLRGTAVGGAVVAAKERGMMLAAAIEAWLDFPEDDVRPMDAEEIATICSELEASLRAASEEAVIGRILREGLSVAIVGRPNVGKSRLLNALLREERAIVADEPGTTRDLVSEVANIRGIPVRLVDSAGMRECADRVEALGVERARNLLTEADIVLAVLDGARELCSEDVRIIGATDVKRSIVVLNKSDLRAAFSDDEAVAVAGGRPWLRVSARTGAGVEALEDAIEAVATSGLLLEGGDQGGMSRRRIECMMRAARSFHDAEVGARSGQPLDMLSIDLRAALDALGELTGDTATEEVIDLLFSEFCVGK
ncbi:MAG: tRNA modification GTPase MnmE [Firmicutes bacterium ADurb.Bin506]|nr:MAG: tRNA modification GTPase MnmE [Firmicutes bacterium ADurb.Bin506]